MMKFLLLLILLPIFSSAQIMCGEAGIIKYTCVNPASITGSLTLTTGSTTQLSDATLGGTWSSSITTVATVGTAGLVTGVGVGTSTISYTVLGGCYSIATVTVTSGSTSYTFNPAILGNNGVLSGSNLILTCSSGNSGSAINFTFSSGMYYADFLINSYVTAVNIGVSNSSGLGDINSGNFIGLGANTWGYLSVGNGARHNGSSSAYGISVSAGDYLQIAVDATNGFIYVGSNNTWMNGGIPTSGALGTNAMFSIPTGTTYYIVVNLWSGSQITKQSPSHYSSPILYTPL